LAAIFKDEVRLRHQAEGTRTKYSAANDQVAISENSGMLVVLAELQAK